MRTYLNDWIDAVCGVSPATLDKWELHIKSRDYFDDTELAGALKDFCAANLEASRYLPLSRLMNRILFLVQGCGPDGERMPGLPDGGPPVDDIAFFRIATAQSSLGEQHKAAVFAMRKSLDSTTTGSECIDWNSVLLFVKLERLDRRHKLLTKLQSRRNGMENSPTLKYVYDDLELLLPPPPKPDPEPVLALVDTKGSTSGKRCRGVKRSRESDDEDDSHQPRVRLALSAQYPRPRIPLEIRGEKAQMLEQARKLTILSKGSRLHHIGMFLNDDYLSLWYLDGLGSVRIYDLQLSIIDNFERAMAIIVALAFCSPEQFGALPIARPPVADAAATFPPKSLSGYIIDMDPCDFPSHQSRCLVTLGDHLYTEDTLIGRQTTVYKAFLPGDDRVYAIKIAQQRTGKNAEVELAKLAKQRGVQHVVDIIKHCDAWKMSEGTRRHAAFSTDDSKDRVMRCLVLPCYTPLAEHLCEHPDSIKEMVNQMLRCIHDLRYKALILHRDISDGNIMCTKRDGQDWFVLSDFEFAISVDSTGKPTEDSSPDCTGTLPFMASELLDSLHAKSQTTEHHLTRVPKAQNVEHCVRFEYESLWWVTLWCATKILGKDIRNKEQEEAERYRLHLEKWEIGPVDVIACFKRDLLTHVVYTTSLPLSPLFEHLQLWSEAFQEPFQRGWLAQNEWHRIKRDESYLAARGGRATEAINVRNSLPTHEMVETWHGAVTLKRFEESFEKLNRYREELEEDPELEVSAETDI